MKRNTVQRRIVSKGKSHLIGADKGSGRNMKTTDNTGVQERFHCEQRITVKNLQPLYTVCFTAGFELLNRRIIIIDNVLELDNLSLDNELDINIWQSDENNKETSIQELVKKEIMYLQRLI